VATEVISTIQPGGGGDYSSIQAWESAGRYDLVSADEIYVGEFDSSGNLSSGTNTRIDINDASWTTDSTRRIVLRPQSGEELTGIVGELDTGQPYAQHTSATTQILYVGSPNVSIKGLQFHSDTSAGSMVFHWVGGESLVEGCLFYWDRSGTSTGLEGLLDIRDASVHYRNTLIVFEVATGQVSAFVLYSQSTDSYVCIAENCTGVFVGSPSSPFTYGVFVVRNGVVGDFTNCYAHIPAGCTNEYQYKVAAGTSTLDITTSYCSETSTEATVDEVAFNTSLFESVTLSSLDLTPASGSDLVDNGTTIGTFSTDINGVSRPSGSSWDIGAIELAQSIPVVVAGTSSMTVTADVVFYETSTIAGTSTAAVGFDSTTLTVPSTVAGTSTVEIASGATVTVPSTVAGTSSMVVTWTISKDSSMSGSSTMTTVPTLIVPSSVAGSSTVSASYFAGVEHDECYDITNKSSVVIIYNSGDTHAGQSVDGDGIYLSRIRVWIEKAGSPTGSLTCSVYAHSGTYGTSSVPTGSALITSTNSIDPATVPSSPNEAPFDFLFDGSLQLAVGTQYVFAVTGVTSNLFNRVQLESDNTAPTHSGNAWHGTLGVPTAESGQDICFCMWGTPVFAETSAVDGTSTVSVSDFSLAVPAQADGTSTMTVTASIIFYETSTVAGTSTMATTPTLIVSSSIAGTSTMDVYDYTGQQFVDIAGTSSVSILYNQIVPSSISGSSTMVTTSRVLHEYAMDEYPNTNASSSVALGIAVLEVAQSFTGDGEVIKRVQVYGAKIFSPTGTVTCEIQDHSGTFGTSSVPGGTTLATAVNTIDVTEMPTSPTIMSMTFNFQGFTTTSGTKYTFVISGVVGAGINFVFLNTDTSSPSHGGNLATSDGATWTAVSGTDLTFIVNASWGMSVAGTSTAVGTNRQFRDLVSTIVEENALYNSHLVDSEVVVSVTSIWNTALATLGVARVTGTSDTSRQGLLLQAVWSDFRKQFLTEHPWAGCKTTQALSRFQNTVTPGDVNPSGTRWNFAYLLPDSSNSRPYLHALYINGYPNTPNSTSGNFWEIEAVENDAGTIKRCLLSNATTISLEYVFDPGDNNITLLSSLTAHALGLSLAWFIAPNFGKPANEREDLRRRAEQAIEQAKGSDGQESTYPLFQNTSLLDARERGWF